MPIMADTESRESVIYAKVVGVLMVILLIYGALTIVGVLR
jgi:hypothetical protein